MTSRDRLALPDLLIAVFLLGAAIMMQSCAGNGPGANPDPPAPDIGGLSVASGPVGTPVTIAGTNFGATQGTAR
ncbi:MAG: hypothetical protein WA434_08395 [Candidatus Acidiferrales bacterium]